MDGPKAPPVVGRDVELRRLEDFLEGGRAAACLVLSGDAGIGKTTLWQAGLELAGRHGYHVLSARTSETEQTLSFAALGDLVDGLSEEDLGAVPTPQRRALEVALRRADPVGGPPDPFAISAGFLNALRRVTERSPLLVAIDDVQWLDPGSSDSLLFAARRLGGRARYLLTRRTGGGHELERALLAAGVDHVELSTLSLGAVARMLSDRLGLSLTRHALREVHEGSHGNPLFAIELARSLGESTEPGSTGQLPLPDLARDVFGAHIGRAGEAARRILLATSLSQGLTAAELASLGGPLAIEDAVAAGLVVIERSRVRPAHPMLAVAAREHADAAERAALHVALASVVADPASRARHLAIATAGPDEGVADRSAAAADEAMSHGRISEAIELGEHAVRLTPRSSPAYGDRVIMLARLYLAAGRSRQLTELVTSSMRDLPQGRHRGLAHLLLCDNPEVTGDMVDAQIDLALAEAGGDPDVRALAFSLRADMTALAGLSPSDVAMDWGVQAVAVAASADAGVRDRARSALAWVRVLRGEPITDLVTPSATRGTIYTSSVERAAGVRSAFRGEVAAARSRYARLRSVAEERGELTSIASLQLQLCEVELRAGHLPEVHALLEDFDDALLAAQVTPTSRRFFVARLRALTTAVAGEPEETARWAGEVLDASEAPPERRPPLWDRLEAERAMGIAGLFRHDTGDAVNRLGKVWEHVRREHVDDPGAFPVAGDLVEALVAGGRYEDATDVIEWLRGRSVEQQHPWGLATAARAESLLRLAESDHYLDEAAEGLGAAADQYGRLGLDFEQARSLLSLGAVQRRYKQRASARASLERAAALFEQNGSGGWADRAREELARVSGRRSATAGDLTPTEQRVVALAADGMSNKEIARQLFVSVNTVEGHLSRAYAKLGVRSRSQLVHRLSESDPPDG